jgi:microcompartment protein CcmK/EutM
MNGNVAMTKGLLSAGASLYYARAAKIRIANKAAAAAAALGNNNKPARRNSDPSANAATPGVTEMELNPLGDEYPVGEEKLSPRSAGNSVANLNSYSGDNGEPLEQEEIDKLMPYLKNTPLLWAAFKGHLRVVWLLLIDGYSPNDTDDMGNNALHLAAVNQHTKVLKILIDDGGSANAVNFYKNRPIDTAVIVIVTTTTTT